MYFLAAGLLLTPIIVFHFRRRPAGPDKKTGGLWILLLVQIFLLTASSYSISLAESVLQLALFSAAAGWYFWGSAQEAEDAKWIWRGVVITGGLLSLTGIAIAANLVPAPAGSVNLLTRTFGHNRLAGYLVFAIPAALAGLGFSSWNKEKIISVLSLAAMAPVFLASGGRAAMLGTILGLWYVGKFSLAETPRLKSFVNLSLIAVLMGLFVLLAVPVILRATQISPQISKLEPVKSIQIMTNRPLAGDTRWDYWRQAARAAREDPRGWGGGTFRLLSAHFRRPQENASSFAHNQYLEMLAEGGFFGGVIYLALVISGLSAAHQGAKKTADPLASSLVAGAWGSALAAVFDFDWQFPSILLLFWLILGITGKSHDNRKLTITGEVLMILVGLYGAAVLFFNSGIGLVSGQPEKFYILGHPQLQKKVFEFSRKKLPSEEFGRFLKRNVKFFQYDNRMMEKVLTWQEEFDTPERAAQTAAAMAENEPGDEDIRRRYLRILEQSP